MIALTVAFTAFAVGLGGYWLLGRSYDPSEL